MPFCFLCRRERTLYKACILIHLTVLLRDFVLSVDRPRFVTASCLNVGVGRRSKRAPRFSFPKSYPAENKAAQKVVDLPLSAFSHPWCFLQWYAISPSFFFFFFFFLVCVGVWLCHHSDSKGFEQGVLSLYR